MSVKEAGFSAADIFPLCKDKRREGAQGVFKDSRRSEFGTLYMDPKDGLWCPTESRHWYCNHQCRVLEW